MRSERRHGAGQTVPALRTEAGGHQPAPPPAEVVELENGAKVPRLGQERRGVHLGAPGYGGHGGATRVGLKMSENGGSETPRPHTLPAGLVQTSHAGPQTLGPTPTPHHHGHHLWKGSPECPQRKGHAVLLKAPVPTAGLRQCQGAALSWCPPRPHPAGKERCALWRTRAY